MSADESLAALRARQEQWHSDVRAPFVAAHPERRTAGGRS